MYSIQWKVVVLGALTMLISCEPAVQNQEEELPPITFSQWWAAVASFEPGGQFEGSGLLIAILDVEDGVVEGQIEKESGDLSFGNFHFPDEGGLIIEGELDWTEERIEESAGPCFAGTIYSPLVPQYTTSLLACVDHYEMLSEMEEEGQTSWIVFSEPDPFFHIEL